MKPQEATRRPRDTPTGRLASDALPRPRHKPPVHPTSSSRPGEWMPEPSGSTPTTAPRRAGQFPCQDSFPVGRHSPALRLIEPPRGAHRHEPSARPRCDDAPSGDGGQAARPPQAPSCLRSAPVTPRRWQGHTREPDQTRAKRSEWGSRAPLRVGGSCSHRVFNHQSALRRARPHNRYFLWATQLGTNYAPRPPLCPSSRFRRLSRRARWPVTWH